MRSDFSLKITLRPIGRKGYIQTKQVANPAFGQLNRENDFLHFVVPERIWSRETDSAVPSRVSQLILHSQAESGNGANGANVSSFSRFPRYRL